MIGLPDVNVLVALLWESHLHHRTARDWFHSTDEPWATCSLTQTGFTRVSSNPQALPEAISVQEARAVLAALCRHDRHQFLVDDVQFVSSPEIPHDRLVGHRQVTDAQLLALARRHDAQVVTFDRGLARLDIDNRAMLLEA